LLAAFADEAHRCVYSIRETANTVHNTAPSI
jgi:hypothetical protein